MALQSEQVAHSELVGGSLTAKHSHAGGGGASLTVSETEVYSGTPSFAWLDLDLSSIVGANPALVLLKLACTSSNRVFAFRKNGDTDEFYNSSSAANASGVALIKLSQAGLHLAILVATDANGVIEYKINGNVTLDIIAYIK